jgi:hypothetical protein
MLDMLLTLGRQEMHIGFLWEIHWENKGDGSAILRRKMSWKDVYIDLESCPVVSSDISCIKPSGFTTRELVFYTVNS